MSPRESIRFPVPPRDIHLVGAAAAPDLVAEMRAAERAGYERGIIEGQRALTEQLLRQRAEVIELHNSAVNALQQAVPQVVRQSEDALIALAFEIAQKLVAELPITREVAAAAVREALDQVEDSTEFTILMHPEDLQLLGADPARAFGGDASGQKVRFAPSPDVSRGGCIAQTRFGIIDTRREIKLARISESLGLE